MDIELAKLIAGTIIAVASIWGTVKSGSLLVLLVGCITAVAIATN